MARISPVNPSEISGKSRELLNAVQWKFGAVPNITKGIANSPAALEGYLAFGAALANGALPPAYREQIALVVSENNGCGYCLSAHAAIGRKVGLSKEEIESSRYGHSLDTKIRAGLTFASALVRSRGWISDTELQAVRDAGHTEEEIVEIIANVALTMFTNYFNHVAETDIDFPRVAVSVTR